MQRPEEGDEARLWDMREYARDVQRFVANLRFPQFQGDKRVA